MQRNAENIVGDYVAQLEAAKYQQCLGTGDR
jgi:hypothetical protein